MRNRARAAIIITAVLVLGGIMVLRKPFQPSQASNQPFAIHQEIFKEETNAVSQDLSAANFPAPSGTLASNQPAPVSVETPFATPQAGSSDREKQLLQALSASFDSGSLASCIRLQNDLSQYWQENAPTADQLTTLIADEDAPPAFRIYIAKVFRNDVKRRSFEETAISNAYQNIRGVIADDAGDPEFRADVANVLTTVDQSDETIQAVTPLLSSSDTVATKAISALCHTTNPLAIDAVYTFATDNPDLANTKPNALAAALPALSTTDREIVPTISHVVTSTANFDLYRAAVQSLIRLPPSSAALAAISQAHAATPRFGTRQPVAEQLCRVAAEQHLKRLRRQEGAPDLDKIKQLEELLNTGEGL